MLDFLHLVDAATSAAERARAYLQSARPPDPSAWGEKGPRDFVTEVDRTAERMIADHLTASVPDSTVIGEEFTPDGHVDGSVVWIVDPLDGTINFLHRYPQFAVSIAALVEGTPSVGVVADVSTGMTYRAWVGGGAWLGDTRLSVSSLRSMDLSLVGTGFPFKRLDLLPTYHRQLAAVLEATAGVRRAGAAALDLVDVAAGRFDGFWELELAPWDIAGGIVLIREAGGVVTSLEGNVRLTERSSVVAGNPWVHEQLLRLLTADE